jgi:uncharacterized membrane protein YgcG
MIEWRRVPWLLWLYSAVQLLVVISTEVKVHGPVPAKGLFAVVMLVWIYFLLKGVRWVWMVTIGVYALGLVLYLIPGSFTWQGVGLSLVGLVLLLLPGTRRHFSEDAVALPAH